MNSVHAGNKAEAAVAAELESQGFVILMRNWRTTFAEIDIIAKRARTIYFVEVKYRKTMAAGDGFDYITSQKLTHMVRAAEAWVRSNQWAGEYVLMGASVIGEPSEYLIDIREIV